MGSPNFLFGSYLGPPSFEAQSHGFCTRYLRFVPPLLTATQDPLPAGGYSLPDRVGLGTHWVPLRGFRPRRAIPLSSAYLAQHGAGHCIEMTAQNIRITRPSNLPRETACQTVYSPETNGPLISPESGSLMEPFFRL
jgi:hypothetical protein